MDRRLKFFKWYMVQRRRAALQEPPSALPMTSATADSRWGKSRRAIISRTEMDYISRCILDYPDRETGGQLWGFVREDGTPVVCLASGPGPEARHNQTSFFQDADNFHSIDDVASGKYSLEHIGEWHSHHRLGLRQPSSGDDATMSGALAKTGREQMLVCIGNINDDYSTSLNVFLFTAEGHSKICWDVRDNGSPMGDAIRRELPGVFPMPSVRSAKCREGADDRRNGRARYISGYWLESRENRLILQEMSECVSRVNGVKPEIIMDADKLFHLRTRLPNGMEDILFPVGFPNVPYVLKRNGISKEVTWIYEGNIFDAFFKSYVLERQKSALY